MLESLLIGEKIMENAEKVNTFQKSPEFQTVRDWVKALEPSGWDTDFIRVLDNDEEFFAWDLPEAMENFQAVLDREVKDSFRTSMDADEDGNPVWFGWELEI